jgi:hypothetical protein
MELFAKMDEDDFVDKCVDTEDLTECFIGIT